MNPFDLAVASWLNGLAAHAVWRPLGIAIGQYGPVPMLVLYLAAWFRPGATSATRRDVHLALALGALAGAAILAINQPIAHFLYRARPFVLDPGRFHAVIAHEPDSSFPSDHTTLAFALVSVAWLARLRFRGVLLALAVLTAAGRVYLGVHWPTDVLASAVLGATMGALVWYARARLRPALAPLVALAERAVP